MTYPIMQRELTVHHTFGKGADPAFKAVGAKLTYKRTKLLV